MAIIRNEHFMATIDAKGAELQRLTGLTNGIEYLWGGDPAVWGKHSPILFPIVGTLKDNRYTYQGKEYHLPRHGFARELEFRLAKEDNGRVRFELSDSSDTLSRYPFHFALGVDYTLTGNRLTVHYTVSNPGPDQLYFSLGAHPAFRVPLAAGTNYADYYLAFNQPETAGRWPISPDGLIEKQSLPLLEATTILTLTKALFAKDALVFKGLKSDQISLKSNATPHGLTMDFGGFPYFGIWAAKGGDFVCLEPWCGIADAVDAGPALSQKEGIQALAVGEEWQRSWSVTLY